MKALHIFDTGERKIFENINFDFFYIGYENNKEYKDEAFEVFQKLKDYELNEDLLFIINLDYHYRLGIHVLKMIRWSGYLQHCIIYSKDDRDTIMSESPNTNSILYSGGVTFYKITSNQHKFNWENVRISDKEVPDLRGYFKSEDTVFDKRHTYANLIAPLYLNEVYKYVKVLGISDEVEKQEFLKKNERDIQNCSFYKYVNSYDGTRDLYLHPINRSILDFICKKEKELSDKDEEKKELSKKIEENLKSEKEIQEKIHHLLLNQERICEVLEVLEEQEKIKSEKNKKEEGKISLFFRKLFEKINYLLGESSQKEEENVNGKTVIDSLVKSREKQKKDKNNEIEEQQKQLENLIEETKKIREKLDKIGKNKPGIVDLQEQLQQKKPRIVYVDDEAKNGFDFVFQNIIYGEVNKLDEQKKPYFHVMIPPSNFDENEFTKQISKQIQDVKADILIMDLRLKKEDNRVDIDSVSGVKILKLLQEQHLPCPILVISASNKIHSYSKALIYGGIGFWQKKGLDEYAETEELVKNYHSFLENIDYLCGNSNVDLLYKEIIPKIKEVEKKTEQLWWEKEFWNSTEQDKSRTDFEKKDIIDILWDTTNAFRELLIKAFLTKELSDKERSIILIRFFHVIEKIHYSKKEDDTITLYQRIKEQFGENFKATYGLSNGLLNKRNDAAHKCVCNEGDFTEFCKEFFVKYLFTIPREKKFSQLRKRNGK